MKIHQSAEDYLETILILQERLGAVRSIDIANELHYSKASISVAMKKLRENGYLEMERDGSITLNPPGLTIARRIYSRHRVIKTFLMDLGVEEEAAATDACKIEHDLSEETFARLEAHALEVHNRRQASGVMGSPADSGSEVTHPLRK